MSEFEIERMKPGVSYTSKERTIIMNVFKYFRQQHIDRNEAEIVLLTSEATGCGEASIRQFRRDEGTSEGVKVPPSKKFRKHNQNSRNNTYNNAVRHAIRNIIYDLKYKYTVVSPTMILKHIVEDPEIPKMSVMTLRRLLGDMGFYYEKIGNRSVLTESQVKIEIKEEPTATDFH